MTQPLDCLCTGIVVADSVCRPIAAMPPAGGLIKTDRIEFSIGGCSANVAVDLARLGLNVGLSGRVGDDLFGREIRTRLNQSGVSTDGLEVSPTAPTSSTFVLNVAGEDRRFIHCVGANAEYDGGCLDQHAISSARSIFLGGFGLMESLTPDRAIRLFRMARAANIPTALNIVVPQKTELSEWIHPILPWTDYFFCNNDEAGQITQQTDPVRQAEQLQSAGARNAIVTHGERGAIMVGSTGRLKSAVYPVQPIDGTGTGDAFAAGFLLGVLKSVSLADCLKWGTAMGASCVQSIGATTGVFNAAELRDFVEANELQIESL